MHKHNIEKPLNVSLAVFFMTEFCGSEFTLLLKTK